MRAPSRAAALFVLVSAALVRAAPQSSTPSPPTLQTPPAPTVRVLTPPEFWGSYAIWGSTGVGPNGHIWFGITSNDEPSGSAHLYEYDPDADTFADRGNVVAELTRLGLKRSGERQMKIHSRIVFAADGYQYFASMDESGEEDDGSKLPTWGGHLWRRGPTGVWEHLFAAPEALIGVATGGPYVYTLGYFNHVLYQFDIRTKKSRSVTVGSARGHVSRNFFVDDRGHAYAPRVTMPKVGPPAAAIVEYDTDLHELGATPLSEYFERGVDESHGIVSVSPNGKGGWYFATGKGRLYEAQPGPVGPAEVKDLGWFHPRGSQYVASMFRDEKSGVLYGAALSNSYGNDDPDWIVRTASGGVTVAPLPYGTTRRFPTGVLLYGSITRDLKGRMYVVGTMNYKPVVLQITPAS
jgi:hypothetical protein